MEDRNWMYRRRVPGVKGITYEFQLGVEEFMKFASQHSESTKVRCPCAKCKNKKFQDPEEVEIHLYNSGFVPNYYRWTSHGEFNKGPAMPTPNDDHVDPQVTNTYREMVLDAAGPNFNFDPVSSEPIEEPPNANAQKFFDMLRAADTPLWDGCTSHSQLSIVSRLVNMKSENRFSEKCFNQTVQLMKEVMPSGSKIPDDFYQMKKLISGLGLPVEKIDVCINGCMLYWKDDMNKRECKICGHARYMRRKFGKKGRYKEMSYKKMYYFPLTPRLQRLFASNKTAEHMRWHAESKSEDDKMSHPRDAEAWKYFDQSHPEFAKEVRNVRLGLCTDGFAPFGISGKQYSCWPVILTPYNLPPWMCMKDSVMFLTVIIPGPKNPKQKIDVYLQPLVEELNELWTVGAHTYDISKKQNFQMRAALLWTVNDFPAYGMLSGWSTAGRLACPYCMERTQSFHLQSGGKHSWFDCHRRFLPHDHAYRRDTRSFRKDKGVERTSSFQHDSGDLMWNRVCQLPKIMETAKELDKGDGRGVYHNWAKRSIFWDLPYWRTNMIRHNIDVMHNEKNVFDNIINTVLDVKGKTKDNIKSRRDLEKYCNRPELQVTRAENGKISLPKACFTLTTEQKRHMLEWLKELKLPDGYASNLGRCADLKELKLSGMKSHDCHVFMERLLPIALKEFLPSNVWSVLTELSLFYRDLCAPKISVAHMLKLEAEIPILLCKLEKIFPPAFFDVMEHLIVHLPYEARVGGPVQYRWMYPFERYMFKLKVKVKNKARVEGSICNAYLVEEASNFFSYYFESHVQTRHTNMSRNDEGVTGPSGGEQILSICNLPGKALGKFEKRFLSQEEYKAATNYILLNCEEVQPYIEKFKMMLHEGEQSISELEQQRRIENEFSKWFRDYVHQQDNYQGIDKCLRNLSWGISRQVKSFSGYMVNGYRFHTRDRAEGRKTNNSGLSVKASEDDADNDYYGVLKEVIEAEFPGNPSQKVVLFKCDWFDQTPNRGVRIHPQYKLVDINCKRNYPKYDPFVLAQQAIQVYYSSYPGSKRNRCDWLAVCKIKARHVIDVPEEDKAYQEDVDDRDAMNIVVGEDFNESLTHECGLSELVDDQVQQTLGDEDSIIYENEDEEEEVDWETDFDTDDDSEEYISDEECSE